MEGCDAARSTRGAIGSSGHRLRRIVASSLRRSILATDGNLVGKGDYRAQVAQCLENIKAVLATEGATLKDVINRRIFVTDMDAYLQAMDGWAAQAYPDFWDRNPEEQSTSPGTLIGVTRLAGKDFMVEIEVFAAIDENEK
jgi:enamine deaminase RidA (YjgF/YER057c/UK114 family)